eukprot:2251531-Prymnesium_polylepis.1
MRIEADPELLVRTQASGRAPGHAARAPTTAQSGGRAKEDAGHRFARANCALRQPVPAPEPGPQHGTPTQAGHIPPHRQTTLRSPLRPPATLARCVAQPTVLILAPTRELATQIEAEAERFASSTGIASVCLYGGAPREAQLASLEKG